MNIKKTMLKEKRELLERYKITEAYFIDRIANGDKSKDADLKQVQLDIDELENLIEFLQK